jgi:outer membrane lipoprotein SlyB
MKLNQLVPLVLLPVTVSLLQGCAHPTSASTFTPGQAQQAQSVQMGVVETVRPVTIQPGPTGVGAVAGGAMGGLAAGSTIGSGNGSILAGLGGALLGGMAGNAVESRVTRRAGVEIGVRLDSGQLIAVTQDADQPISPGDRVRVLSGGGVTRVTR